MKRRALSRGADRPQAPTVGLDDGAADAQSHAGTLKLRGKKRIKHLFRQFRRKADPSITDRNENMDIFSGLRLDDDHPPLLQPVARRASERLGRARSMPLA